MPILADRVFVNVGGNPICISQNPLGLFFPFLVCLQGQLDKFGEKLVCTMALVWAIVCTVQIVLLPSLQGQSFLLSSSL